MGVTRLLPKEQPPEADALEKLDRIMGSTEWVNRIYQPPAQVQLSLFENLEPSLSRETIKAEWLASLYTEQLSSVFPHVSKAAIMKNSTNSALYALCLASHNPTAVKITNDIFKRYERLNQM
jgi:three-Cys-motif partner protein